MFYSLTKLSAPVQQVLYQMKIVTTAGSGVAKMVDFFSGLIPFRTSENVGGFTVCKLPVLKWQGLGLPF